MLRAIREVYTWLLNSQYSHYLSLNYMYLYLRYYRPLTYLGTYLRLGYLYLYLADEYLILWLNTGADNVQIYANVTQRAGHYNWCESQKTHNNTLREKPSDCVLFIECVLASTFHVDLIVFVEVDTFLNCLKHVVLVFRQRRWYVHWHTLPLAWTQQSCNKCRRQKIKEAEFNTYTGC